MVKFPEHLALRKRYESLLTGKGHSLGRWNGTLEDKTTYCQTCRSRLRLYGTRRSNPNTAGGKLFDTSNPQHVLVAEGSLLSKRPCPHPR
jgi:hypothetical protein